MSIDKQIIIDGVNVAECDYIFTDRYNDKCCSMSICGDSLCKPSEMMCISYVKGLKQQLQYKEQECEELKEELKEIKKYLGIESKTIMQRLEELQGFRDMNKLKLFNYEQALEKIEEVVNTALALLNLNKTELKTAVELEARFKIVPMTTIKQICYIINEVKNDN